MDTLELVIKIGVSYMLGSVVGSLLLGRFQGVDLRRQGSGNPGGTNALRLMGPRFAVGVMLIDMGKGALAAGLLAPASLTGGGMAYAPGTVALACGAAAVAGHVWPLWHGFRGGKGAATLLGVVAVVQPWAITAVLAVFVVVLGLTGFVGLATMAATASLAAWAGLAVPGGLLSPFGLFATAMTAFIIYTHRINIRRMRDGTEHVFERARFLRRRQR